jgi:hypothetical protein
MLTGIATAVALVVVLLSIDFGKLATGLHQLKFATLAVAASLLVVNYVLAFLRFVWTLRALGVRLEPRTGAYAFALGNLASQFLFNIVGQSLTRAVVLEGSGVAMGTTVAATYIERGIALLTLGPGAAIAAVFLYGSLGFDLRDGGAYLLSVLFAMSAVLGLAGLRGLNAGIAPGTWREVRRTTGKLGPAFLLGVAAHIAMFAAYAVLVLNFMPNTAVVKLAPAVVIVMFGAGLPVSWAGWGLREFSALYAFGAIGVTAEAAALTAITIGAISLFIMLAAGGIVVVGAWRRPGFRPRPPSSKEALASGLAPSDPLLLWTIVVLAACLIFFQLRIPTGGEDLTINAADPLALTALFLGALLAWRTRFLQLFPRPVLWSVGALAAALALGSLVAWLGPGVSEWALVNRVVGFFVLLGYATIPALAVMISGERGRTLLVETFAIAAGTISVIQVSAYVVNLYITPIPMDFFGYEFNLDDQLEGYAQNPNAFAFQLLMAMSLLTELRRSKAWSLGRSSFLVLAIVLFGTVIVTRSRAGIFCLFVASALLVALPRLHRRGLVKWKPVAIAGVTAGAAVVLAILFRATIDNFLLEPFYAHWRPNVDASDTVRLQSIIGGIQIWLEHPFFGGGLGSFLLSREAAGLKSLVILSVPVWFLAEMGLVGLLAYFWFAGAITLRGVSGLREGHFYASSLLAIVVIFVLMGLVHDIFAQRTFWFAASLALVTTVPSRRSPAVSQT